MTNIKATEDLLEEYYEMNEELLAQIEGWKAAYENYLDDHDSRFIPPTGETK